jgi:hypothetical protein
MLKQRLLALALTGALTGCYVESYPEDPFDPNFPEDPTLPSAGAPDLQIESVTGPSQMGPNSQDFLRARLCNRGGGIATTDVSFFLSKDKFLDPLDRRVGTSEQVTVKAGDCKDVMAQVMMQGVAQEGYYLSAVADPSDWVMESSETNNERIGPRIWVDRNAPPVPTLSWVTGTQMLASSELGTKILVYQGSTCSGEPVVFGYPSQDGYCVMPIDISSYPAASYSARAYDSVGNASGCGTIPAPGGSNGYDVTPPAPPVITEANWQYSTTQHGLTVKGTTEPGAEVGVFVDVACTGMPAATVFASSTGAFTAQLTVAALSGGSTRRVYVAARDAALNESTCVEGPRYETPCPAGYANCDGNAANGCEANLTEDEAHCGTCGTSCQGQGNATGVCVSGTCGVACPVGSYDCDGNAANGCESTYACSPTVCTINSAAELAITALSVVEDPVRTAPGGAWHFGTLMRAMAGDQDPSTMVRNWLKTWTTAQTINGLTLPARPQMVTKVLGPWEEKSGGASRPLDFSKAPFRLLAIVNRMDLRNPGVQSGEGRFVFGVLDGAGNPLEFTVILEYALPGGTPEAIQAWARDWHELGQLGLSHPNYKAKLQALTDRFAKSGVMTGRPFGNALNQIRTNEVDLADPWEMREFNLTTAGLVPATVKLTPAFGFNNTSALGDFLRANQADVLAERHTVPATLNNQRFLGAAALVPEDFFWRAPSVAAEVRHKFSLNTCSGCHAGETATEFVHIAPRRAGQQAALSAYLRGGTVVDPVTQTSRTFNDLGRRSQDLASLVCGTQGQSLQGVETFGGFPAPSNLPRARVH